MMVTCSIGLTTESERSEGMRPRVSCIWSCYCTQFPMRKRKHEFLLIDRCSRRSSTHEEGVIAKRAASLYYSGKRTREWLKFKAVHEQEVVIVGYTEPRR